MPFKNWVKTSHLLVHCSKLTILITDETSTYGDVLLPLVIIIINLDSFYIPYLEHYNVCYNIKQINFIALLVLCVTQL